MMRVELLIDLTGRPTKIGKRDVAVAIAKLGYIHIRAIGRSVTVTLMPRLVHPLTLAAAAYEIADLEPDRTIVVAGAENNRCRVSAGYMSAIRTMASLAGDTGGADTGVSADAIKYLL